MRAVAGDLWRTGVSALAVGHGRVARSALVPLAVLAAALLPGTALATPLKYLESGGQVVMEAEIYSARSAPVDLPEGLGGDTFPDQWLLVPGEYAGSVPFHNPRGDFLQVADANGPNGEGNFTDPLNGGPFLDYVMSIQTTGTYELFARWDAPSRRNDSFYAFLFDPTDTLVGVVSTFSGNNDQDFATDPWDMNSQMFAVTSAGDYTLRVAPREDGVALDALVFQLDHLRDPSGDGPPISLTTPEPSSFALLCGGLAGLACARRRRARPDPS